MVMIVTVIEGMKCMMTYDGVEDVVKDRYGDAGPDEGIENGDGVSDNHSTGRDGEVGVNSVYDTRGSDGSDQRGPKSKSESINHDQNKKPKSTSKPKSNQ